MDRKELARLDCSSHIVSSRYANPTNILFIGHLQSMTWTFVHGPRTVSYEWPVTALQYAGQTHWALVFHLARDK